ncbi:MAG: hypothetical protein IJZ29_02500 [Clostridia bacterium]|nr:hypothetical protein [Clostridia bacterium]
MGEIDLERKENLHNEFFTMHQQLKCYDVNKTPELRDFIFKISKCYSYFEDKNELDKCEKLLELLKNNTYNDSGILRFYGDYLHGNVKDFIFKLYSQTANLKLRSPSLRAEINKQIIENFEK